MYNKKLDILNKKMIPQYRVSDWAPHLRSERSYLPTELWFRDIALKSHELLEIVNYFKLH